MGVGGYRWTKKKGFILCHRWSTVGVRWATGGHVFFVYFLLPFKSTFFSHVMMVVLPPDNRRRAVGRPRKNKILSQEEDKMRYKCGQCKQVGHNRIRCTEPIAHENVGTSGGGR